MNLLPDFGIEVCEFTPRASAPNAPVIGRVVKTGLPIVDPPPFPEILTRRVPVLAAGPGRSRWTTARSPALDASNSIPDRVVDMEPIDVEAFEVLVATALATIPEELRADMDNVAIIIDDESPPGPFYGLYEGVPLTSRGGYAGVSPDRISTLPGHHLSVGRDNPGVGQPGAGHTAARGRSPLRHQRCSLAAARLGLGRMNRQPAGTDRDHPEVKQSPTWSNRRSFDATDTGGWRCGLFESGIPAWLSRSPASS